MVENIFRHLAEHKGPTHRGSGVKIGLIASAAREVNRAIFFSASIIIVGFLPLFTLTGVEGHIFGPMAKTYAYALVGGLLATYTVSPALSALILPNHVEERDTIVVKLLRALFRPLQGFTLNNRILTILMTVAMLGCTGVAMRTLGLEFLPTLEEGNLYIRGTMPASISLEAGNPYVERMRKLIGSYPEVTTVVSHQAVPTTAPTRPGSSTSRSSRR